MLSVSTGVHWRYRYSNFPSYFFDGGPSTTTQVSIVILSKVDKWDSNINETLHVCSIQLKPFQCLNISIWKYVWPRMQQLKQLWMYLMWQFYFERSIGYYLTSRCILKSRLSILNSSWTKIYMGDCLLLIRYIRVGFLCASLIRDYYYFTLLEYYPFPDS